jgi:hypothetical protein
MASSAGVGDDAELVALVVTMAVAAATTTRAVTSVYGAADAAARRGADHDV